MDTDAAERFVALVADPAGDPPLDEGALLIAATATGIDVEAWMLRLDELAGAALAFPDARNAPGLAQVLFVDWAFAGNTADYADPRNSFLPHVVDRRLGLPITLSVLMIEIGRRIGLQLHGVGMPGHFLVGVAANPDEFVDPFHAGVVLDRGGCAARFAAQYGAQVHFEDAFLAPTGSREILLRMLHNLGQSYGARRSPESRWVASLLLAFPELPPGERERAAEVLASVGAFAEAAATLAGLAETAPDGARDQFHRRAVAYRARSN